MEQNRNSRGEGNRDRSRGDSNRGGQRSDRNSSGRSERSSGRSDRAGRSESSDRNGAGSRPRRSSNSDWQRSDRNERSDRYDRGERSERNDRGDRSDKPANRGYRSADGDNKPRYRSDGKPNNRQGNSTKPPYRERSGDDRYQDRNSDKPSYRDEAKPRYRDGDKPKPRYRDEERGRYRDSNSKADYRSEDSRPRYRSNDDNPRYRRDDSERSSYRGKSDFGEKKFDRDRPRRDGDSSSGNYGRKSDSGSRFSRNDNAGKRFSRDDSRSGSRYSRRDDALEPRTDVQQRYDGPELSDDITGKEVARHVAQQLKSLPEKLGIRVARHLVAAEQLLGTDPELAHQHTLAARSRAGRLAIVREAVGEAAYAAGKFSEALAELRSARRMNGAQDYVPMMADCERALGRPDRALALLREIKKADLAPAFLVEVLLVEAGARLDRNEPDAALLALEQAPLHSKSRDSWALRLRYAYADAQLATGATAEALTWFHKAAALDHEGVTDALERIAELEGS